MKCIFIYNPNSGKGKIAKKLDYIKKRLSEKYERVDVYATRFQGDMENKIKEIVKQNLYDAIIFSGGDGTFNNVLQGLSGVEKKPVLGYIPSGTVNDVAHSLKISKNIKRALNVIVGNTTAQLDCLKINDREYAMYIVAAGMFTNVAYSTPQLSKKFLGKLAYGLEGVKTNASFNSFPVKITVDDKEVSLNAYLVFALNSRSVAGLKMNPQDSMNDGVMEIAVVQNRLHHTVFARFLGLCNIAHLFIMGYRNPNNGIVCLSGKKVRFETEKNITWAYDGEKGTCGSVTIEVVPKAIEMFVPTSLKKI